MKKLLFLLMLVPMFVSAQYDSTKQRQTITSYGFDWKNGKFGTLVIPNDTIKMAVKDSNALAAIGGRLYRYTGYYWENTVNATLPIYVDTMFRQNDSLVFVKNGIEYNLGALNGVDSIWLVDGGGDPDTLRYRFLGADYTVGIITGGGGSSSWGFITGTLSSQTDLQTALNLKLNILDTAAMLLGYLRLSDTAAMLNPYLRKADTTGKWIGIGWLATLAAKQDALVSGTNIKTVNGNSLLGSGDISISAGTTNADSTAARIVRGTFAQRPAAPDTGQIFEQTDRLAGLWRHNGSKWVFQGAVMQYAGYNQYSGNSFSGSGYNLGGSGTTSGTGATIGTFHLAGVGGTLRMQTGTTSGGVATQFLTGGISTPEVNPNYDSVTYYIEGYVMLPVLSDGTDTYTFLFGSSTNSLSVSFPSYGLRYTHGTNSGKWQSVTRAHNSGSLTTKDAGVTVAAGQWYKVAVELNGFAKTITFFIDDVLVTTHTTSDNIFYNGTITWGAEMSLGGVGIIKSAGSTNRIAYCDYQFAYITKQKY